MQATPKVTQPFQTTAFKVKNTHEFTNLPTVKHIHRVMVSSGLSIELYHGHFSFGLSTMSALEFPFDNDDIYTSNDLLKLLLVKYQTHRPSNVSC